MIIISDTPGQLSNQLWAYCNMIALAKECNANIAIVLNRGYYDMLDTPHIKLFRNIKIYPDDSFAAKCIKRVSGFIRFRIRTKGFFQFLIKHLPVRVIENYISENQFKSCYKQYHYYFLNSWEQRSNKLFFIKHYSFIRSLILPYVNTRTNVDERMRLLKTETPVIVGVHIRRGDYKQFMGGSFFFNDDIYAGYIKQLQLLLQPHKVLFYIFSHEKIDINNFKDLNIYFKKDQSPISDLWAMSQCNYIIGPPSTFSMWASFWKEAPLCFIDQLAMQLSLHQFRPVIAQDVFKERNMKNQEF